MKKRKTWITFLSILLIILIAAGTYAYSLLNRIEEKPLGEGIKKIDKKEDLGITENAPEEKKTGVVNILLFGVDRRTKNEASRSDSIMIATIDKKNDVVKLTSLMRDMYVPIPGKKDNRINAAYAFGGPELAIKTINTNFNLDIQRYATVDFFGLEAIIDKLDGVEIEITSKEAQLVNSYMGEVDRLDKSGKKGSKLPGGGVQNLSGRQAVAYSRIRAIGNDYQRTERQRTVLNAIFKKAKSTSPLKFPDLVATILPYVETNVTKTEMVTLGMSVMGFKSKEIQQYRLPVNDTFKSQKIRGMQVLVPDIPKNTELLHGFIYGNNNDNK